MAYPALLRKESFAMNKEGLSNALILYYNYMDTTSTFVVEFVVEFVVVYHATT